MNDDTCVSLVKASDETRKLVQFDKSTLKFTILKEDCLKIKPCYYKAAGCEDC